MRRMLESTSQQSLASATPSKSGERCSATHPKRQGSKRIKEEADTQQWSSTSEADRVTQASDAVSSSGLPPTLQANGYALHTPIAANSGTVAFTGSSLKAPFISKYEVQELPHMLHFSGEKDAWVPVSRLVKRSFSMIVFFYANINIRTFLTLTCIQLCRAFPAGEMSKQGEASMTRVAGFAQAQDQPSTTSVWNQPVTSSAGMSRVLLPQFNLALNWSMLAVLI